MRALAPGLRATPSAAAPATRDWPMAASAAASPKPSPAARALYLPTEKSLSAAAFCAKAGTAVAITPTTAKRAILNLFMESSPVVFDPMLEHEFCLLGRRFRERVRCL